MKRLLLMGAVAALTVTFSATAAQAATLIDFGSAAFAGADGTIFFTAAPIGGITVPCRTRTATLVTTSLKMPTVLASRIASFSAMAMTRLGTAQARRYCRVSARTISSSRKFKSGSCSRTPTRMKPANTQSTVGVGFRSMRTMPQVNTRSSSTRIWLTRSLSGLLRAAATATISSAKSILLGQPEVNPNTPVPEPGEDDSSSAAVSWAPSLSAAARRTRLPNG